MQSWWFTEDCYPHLPDESTYRSIRVDLPNQHCDPEVANDLYNRYLDLWCACDEIGLGIMLNEHHQTATCMVPAAPIMLGILARQTQKSRLLILGNPLPNRNQPVRVAEEMALVDVISKGRVECGFVRSVPYEAAAANIMPYRGSDRMWEAHDLILKAWTTHDGPFNFEGEWYHHRQVNIWPRPYQQPHPPVWITMGSNGSARPVAQHKHVARSFLQATRASAKFSTAIARAILKPMANTRRWIGWHISASAISARTSARPKKVHASCCGIWNPTRCHRSGVIRLAITRPQYRPT